MANEPSQPKLSRIQRLFVRLMPARAAELEHQSREWKFICAKCELERSVWELGGIRYNARGAERRLLRCPSCGSLSWHRLQRRTSPDAPA